MAAGRESSKPPRSRFSRTPDRRVMLTDRDREIVSEVFANRLLSRDHLIGLGFFGSVSRANLTLRRLFDAGMLRRVYPALGSYGAQALYGIGPAATGLVTARFGMEPEDVARLACKDPGRLHVEHTARVSDVRLMLHRATEAAGIGFRWVPEVFARHEYEVRDGGVWRCRILKPDAFFTLTAVAGQPSHHLLEVDLGHVGRPQWARSVRQYGEHEALGLLEEAYGVRSASVLTLTTGGTLRMRHLMEPVTGGSRRFLFATFDDVDRQSILGPCWRFADGARSPLPALGGVDALL